MILSGVGLLVISALVYAIMVQRLEDYGDAVIHRIHDRVLRHVKALSEAASPVPNLREG